MSLSAPQPADGRFATTHWSLVVAAGEGDSYEAREALAALCRTYWYPLYAYVRRRGYDASEAEDLTQGFFARLLEKHDLADVRRERGRFRSFLLASLRHFLANEWDRQTADKRGGGRPVVSIDFAKAEDRLSIEPAHDLTPERIFEKRWALTLLDQALASLRQEFTAAGKEHQFERLRGFLAPSESDSRYQDVAAELGMTEGAVKVAVHRLRRRFRELLRSEIARTVADPAEIDEEIRDLFAALGS